MAWSHFTLDNINSMSIKIIDIISFSSLSLFLSQFRNIIVDHAELFCPSKIYEVDRWLLCLWGRKVAYLGDLSGCALSCSEQCWEEVHRARDWTWGSHTCISNLSTSLALYCWFYKKLPYFWLPHFAFSPTLCEICCHFTKHMVFTANLILLIGLPSNLTGPKTVPRNTLSSGTGLMFDDFLRFSGAGGHESHTLWFRVHWGYT